ncbi:hypothetical protein [Pediococcus acidilactici]|nr:hypothetical protein [Pediococcus acidilactici]
MINEFGESQKKTILRSLALSQQVLMKAIEENQFIYELVFFFIV